MKIAAFVPDLFDRSRITTAVAAAGGEVEVEFLRDPEGFASSGADVVLVDLARPGALDVIASAIGSARVIAFGPHVDTDVLVAAREAGADEVLPRSQFFKELGAIVGVSG